MLEKEFNKAKNNIINLFHRCRVLDTVKLAEIKNTKKVDVDEKIDIKNVIKIDKLKLDMSKTKLVEYEYTKTILENFVKGRYPSMSNVEQKVLVNRALKNIFNLKVDIDTALKTKEDLFVYAYLIKTGLYSYPLNDYLNGVTMNNLYGQETWKKFIECLEKHEEKLKTNPTARQDICEAQTIIATSALEDLSKYDDVADYVVRTQYVIDSPVKNELSMKELIYKYDLEFIKNNNVKETSGIAKIFTLRDTLSTINGLNSEDDKLRYIYEFNSLVKAFNNLKRSNHR